MKRLLIGIAVCCAACAVRPGAPPAQEGINLWQLARQRADVLRFSTLFTAQNVREYLSTNEGLEQAVQWCKDTAVTHVYLEVFRGNYWAEREVLERARDRFRRDGFLVSGCVTTTGMEKKSTGWNIISCYTDPRARQTLNKVFRYAAELFDETMIDDFLFTDCACQECRQAKGEQSWAQYRLALMMDVTREDILAPAREVNPKAKIIIKYPQWYDNFHERGYDVDAQTKAFDKIWVGTETRDYDDERWGGTVQYEAYFIMRWLGQIGGRKCGGGWFDPYGTTENTYVEQARQTVLAGAREALLFCYGSLQSATGPANVAKFRTEVPSYFELAPLAQKAKLRGVHTCKPPNSDAGPEKRVFDFVGMMGLPLVPAGAVDPKAKAVFFSVHALKDPDFPGKLNRIIARGAPVLLTSNLVARLGDDFDASPDNAHVLSFEGDPKALLELKQE
ncbi:MAG: hypothetical protein ACE5R4_09245, partial [Armatimonadota bacterium]